MDETLANIRRQMDVLQRADRVFDPLVLFALFDSGVLAILANGPATKEELQEQIRGSGAMLDALLEAAVAVNVLRRNDLRYSASDDLLDCLGRPASSTYIGESVALLHALVKPLAAFGEAVRSQSVPSDIASSRELDSAPSVRMTDAMDAYARTRGRELADRIDFSEVDELLDLGCGPGTYATEVLERQPRVRATLLDLAGPIREARRLAARKGLTNRISFIEADVRTYEPGERFDAVLISNTLHMLGPADAQNLIARVHGFLKPGGRLIVQAQFLNEDRTSPRWPVLLNLIQHVVTEHGRNHTIAETMSWLQDASFTEVHHVPFSLWNVCSCVVGRRR